MSKQKSSIRECSPTIPVDNAEVATFRLHLDIDIRNEQATALRRVASALDKRNERLLNGRRCVTVNDAMRWLLEQIK